MKRSSPPWPSRVSSRPKILSPSSLPLMVSGSSVLAQESNPAVQSMVAANDPAVAHLPYGITFRMPRTRAVVLRGSRLVGVEQYIPEALRERKQLIVLLVKTISLGKSQEDRRAEIQTTYRFGPPPAEFPASDAESVEGLSMPSLKNGSRS